MGSRQIPNLGLQLDDLSLTKEMDSRMNKGQLIGRRTFYNPIKNRYETDSHKNKLSRNSESKDQIYTLPFINIHDIANVFNMGKDEMDYGEKIRIVRLT